MRSGRPGQHHLSLHATWSCAAAAAAGYDPYAHAGSHAGLATAAGGEQFYDDVYPSAGADTGGSQSYPGSPAAGAFYGGGVYPTSSADGGADAESYPLAGGAAYGEVYPYSGTEAAAAGGVYPPPSAGGAAYAGEAPLAEVPHALTDYSPAEAGQEANGHLFEVRLRVI
jgi:hypothetical protein